MQTDVAEHQRRVDVSRMVGHHQGGAFEVREAFQPPDLNPVSQPQQESDEKPKKAVGNAVH